MSETQNRTDQSGVEKPWKMEPVATWSPKLDQEWRDRGGMMRPAGRALAVHIIENSPVAEVLEMMNVAGGWYWDLAEEKALESRLIKEYGQKPTEWNLLLDKAWSLNFGPRIVNTTRISVALKRLGREVSTEKIGSLLLAHEIGNFEAATMLYEAYLPEIKVMNGRRAYNLLQMVPQERQVKLLARSKWAYEEIQAYVEEVWNDFSTHGGHNSLSVLIKLIEHEPKWLGSKPREEFSTWVERTMREAGKEAGKERLVGLLVRAWPIKPSEVSRIYQYVKSDPWITGLLAENPMVSVKLMRQILQEVPSPGVRRAAARRADCVEDKEIRAKLMEEGRNKAIWVALLETAKDQGEIEKLTGYLGTKDPRALQKIIAAGKLGAEVKVPKTILAKMIGSEDRETRVGAAGIFPKVKPSADAPEPMPAQATAVRAAKKSRPKSR